jgi:hypothetical protein
MKAAAFQRRSLNPSRARGLRGPPAPGRSPAGWRPRGHDVATRRNHQRTRRRRPGPGPRHPAARQPDLGLAPFVRAKEKHADHERNHDRTSERGRRDREPEATIPDAARSRCHGAQSKHGAHPALFKTARRPDSAAAALVPRHSSPRGRDSNPGCGASHPFRITVRRLYRRPLKGGSERACARGTRAQCPTPSTKGAAPEVRRRRRPPLTEGASLLSTRNRGRSVSAACYPDGATPSRCRSGFASSAQRAARSWIFERPLGRAAAPRFSGAGATAAVPALNARN